MADLNFNISPNIVLGAYTSFRLGQYAKEWGQRYMVIIDPVLKDIVKTEKILDSLDIRSVSYFIFDEVGIGSDSQTMETALKLARDACIQGVIAIGGASIQGIGRIVSALYNEKSNFYEYIDSKIPESDAIPFIAVPSTVRSMFLFTDSVPVTDARSRQTRILKIQPSLCKLAIFDSNLHVSLPENQAGAIVLETLCLSCEAYLSQKANFFSDMFAEKAISVLGEFINYSENTAAGSNQAILLSESGCLASIAAGVSSIGPASLIALTAYSRYNITRTLTTAIIFPHMIEDIAKYKEDKVVKIAELLGVTAETNEPKDIISSLLKNIRQRLALTNLPARLKDLSLSIEEFAMAVEDAGQLDLINGMPRSMSTDDLFSLMKISY